MCYFFSSFFKTHMHIINTSSSSMFSVVFIKRCFASLSLPLLAADDTLSAWKFWEPREHFITIQPKTRDKDLFSTDPLKDAALTRLLVYLRRRASLSSAADKRVISGPLYGLLCLLSGLISLLSCYTPPPSFPTSLPPSLINSDARLSVIVKMKKGW